MNDRPLDRIVINKLRLRCVVGIADWEQGIKQDVAISIVLHLDLSAAGKSDDVADTVDYKRIKQRVMASVEERRFKLIERMAEAVAAICLDEAGVQRVDVVVDKLGALRYADSVQVHISRIRGS